MKRGNGRLTQAEKEARRRDIALGLAVISAVREPGETLNLADMAEVCGCSPTTMENLYHGAMRKLEKAAKRMAERERV
jgi:hypothetical protein